MTRFLFPILFVLTLVSPFALRLFVAGDDSAPAASAGAPRLVILTPHQPDIKTEYARAFSAWHAEKYGTPVTLDYRDIGGTNDIIKALGDLYATFDPNASVEAIDSQTPYDMVWGGGDYVFDQDLERGLGVLQAVEMPSDFMAEVYPQTDIAGINLYDQDDDGTHWYGVCLSSFGIVYSPAVMDALRTEFGDHVRTPQTWTDLTQPELSGMVNLADPGKSGSAAVAFMMVLQRAIQDAEDLFLATGRSADDPDYQAALERGWQKGMGDLLIIAANADHFTDHSSNVPPDVSNANTAAGMAIDFYGRTEEDVVGSERIRFVSPEAATAITPDPVAVLRGTTGDKLELAKHFIEFLLSPEGQRLWILNAGEPGGPRERSLRRPPIRKDAYADTAGWADQINPFDDAGNFNQRSEWMREFTSTRMIWQAAWIESQDQLKSAYKAILAVDDTARRDALIAELRDLPITWNDVRAIRAGRKASDPDEPSEQPALIEIMESIPADHFDAARALEDLTDGETLYMTKQRMWWAQKFRAHYAAVKTKA